MDDIRGYLIIGIVIAGILETIRSIRIYREAIRKHPVVKLKGKLKSEKWRLREPPEQLGLKTFETPDKSVIELPVRSAFAGTFINICGYGMILIVLVAVITGMANSLFDRSNPSIEPLGVGAVLLLGLTLVFFLRLFLLIGEKVIRVELKPGVMLLITRYGLFLHRRFRFKPNRNLIIERQLILERDEEAPSFVLVFRQKWLRWTSLFRKRMTFCINPSQGAWLAAELDDWNKRQLTPDA